MTKWRSTGLQNDLVTSSLFDFCKMLFPKRISMRHYPAVLFCWYWPSLICTVTPQRIAHTGRPPHACECTGLYKSRSSFFAIVFIVGKARQRKKMSSPKALIFLAAVTIPQCVFQPLLSQLNQWYLHPRAFPSRVNVLWNDMPSVSSPGNS